MESGFSALPWESGFCFQPWNLGSLFCYRTRGWQGLAQFLANGLRFQYLLWQLVEFHAFLCAGRWRRGRLGPETSVVKLATLCRARLVEEMGKDAPGRARLEAYDTNVNRNIAERIRDADADLAAR